MRIRYETMGRLVLAMGPGAKILGVGATKAQARANAGRSPAPRRARAADPAPRRPARSRKPAAQPRAAGKKHDLPAPPYRGSRTPGAQRMVLQTIIVSKARAATRSEAFDIARRFARGSPGAADETSRSYRFRQREPSRFVRGSFRTIKPTDGVSLVVGHLRGERKG